MLRSLFEELLRLALVVGVNRAESRVGVGFGDVMLIMSAGVGIVLEEADENLSNCWVGLGCV